MTATLANLNNWINNAMSREGITNYKLDVSGNSVKGDGYLGEITFVKVTGNFGKIEKDIYLVVKSAKDSEEVRKQMPIKEAYDREIFMYIKVFPILREFQKDCGLEMIFNKFPRCYSASSEDKKEALIMENLKMYGFEIHNRRLPQNLNHVLFVFRNYGKFHAISYALRTKRPALFRSLTKNMSDVMGKFINQMQLLPSVTKNFKAIIDILRKNEEKLVERYEGFQNHLEEYLTKYSDENNLQSVILHGDCWNNNMMFKYENGNKSQPVDMCFIDFQLSRVASPVFDLSYYLYTCADKSVLDHFDFLLQAYHTSLSDSLKDYGCDSEDILTFKQLKEHWSKYGKYGLSLAPLIVKIELCQSDEVIDFTESAENGEGFGETFNFKLQEQDVYEKRLYDVFSHFAEKFL